MPKSFAARVTLAYVGLAVIAVCYALYRGNFARANSEFSGLPLIVLALPWSWWMRGVEIRVLESPFNNSVAVMSAWIALNAALLFVLGRVIDRAMSR
jgi:hypothetical protein